MRQHLTSSLIAIILLCLLSYGCKDDNKQSGELRLLSYNVAGLPEGLSSSSPATYTSSISPLLNDYHIVHVQEDFCYHDSLILYNEHPYTTPPTPCVPDGDGMNTFSDYPIRDFQRFPWNQCYGTDCLTPKGYSFSKIDVAEGVSIHFYNLHCNAGGSEPNMEARRGNIAQITEHIIAHSEGEAVVVMGDFNSRYTRLGDTIRTFQDLGFSDFWVDLVRAGDIPTYGDSLKDCDPVGSGAHCEGVDKILYRSGDRIALSPLEYLYGDDDRFTYNGVDSLHLSDHLPLYGKLAWEER